MNIPPGPLSQKTAAELSKKFRDLDRLAQQSPQSNISGGTATVNRNPNDIFPALLTAVSGGLYTWQEQFSKGADYAGWNDLIGGRFGSDTATPAFEPNDVAIDVTTPVLAFIQRAYIDSSLGWVYVIVSFSETGTGTLEVTDGVTTVTGVDEINFTSGATVTSGGPGIADVAISGGGTSSIVYSATNTFSAIGTIFTDTFTATSAGVYLVIGTITQATFPIVMLPGDTLAAVIVGNGTSSFNGATQSINGPSYDYLSAQDGNIGLTVCQMGTLSVSDQVKFEGTWQSATSSANQGRWTWKVMKLA